MLARNSGGLCGSMVRYAAPARSGAWCATVGPVHEQLRRSSTDARRLGRDHVRRVADGQAAEVADVLADGERAVDVLAGERARREAVVLLDQRLRLHLERRLVVRRPPVVEVAGTVVLRALVVEAVADLVADHGPDAAVVLGRLGVRAEERPLQDPAGKQISLVPGL